MAYEERFEGWDVLSALLREIYGCAILNLGCDSSFSIRRVYWDNDPSPLELARIMVHTMNSNAKVNARTLAYPAEAVITHEYGVEIVVAIGNAVVVKVRGDAALRCQE